MTESKETSSEEIRPEIRQKIDFAEKIIKGDYAYDFPDEESLDPQETFSGPILDQNDESLNGSERKFLEEWLKEKLGLQTDLASVKTKYKSPDGQTEVWVYDKRLGEGWFLSRWQNKGEKPSFVFWQEEVYEWQVEEAGFEEIEKDK